MSLINRIKKAKAKAEKLSEKSKQAKSKGKAARLEKRSDKKSAKANKLSGKLTGKFVNNFKFPPPPKPFPTPTYATPQMEELDRPTPDFKFKAPTKQTINYPKYTGPKDTSYKKPSPKKKNK